MGRGAIAIRPIARGLASFAAAASLFCWLPVANAQQMVRPDKAAPGSSRSKKKASTSPEEMTLLGYTISPGDLLDVYVVGVPQLSRTYRVSPFGELTLPMLSHPIPAKGLTPNQLSQAIAKALRREQLVSHADVLVTVRSSPSNSVAVTGAVVNPGVYPIYGQTTVLDVVSKAGGLAPDAASTAIVMRGSKAMQILQMQKASTSTSASGAARASPRIIRVPIRHLLDTGDQQQNVLLYPGDRLDVPRAGIIYVVGAVKRAGGFALTGEKKHLTVLQAIALAGNVTHTAASKRTVIITPNLKSTSGHQEIHVNLKKILAGKAPDRELAAGDILFVPESTGKRVFARAIAAATTVAIYRVPF